jgi:hypothetical protein
MSRAAERYIYVKFLVESDKQDQEKRHDHYSAGALRDGVEEKLLWHWPRRSLSDSGSFLILKREGSGRISVFVDGPDSFTRAPLLSGRPKVNGSSRGSFFNSSKKSCHGK